MSIQDVAYKTFRQLPDNATREDLSTSVEQATSPYLEEVLGDDYATQEYEEELDNTPFGVWVAPLQAENLNRAGKGGFDFLYTLSEEEGTVDEDGSFRDAVNWLCESQGYEFSDLFDEKKRERSVFLASFYDELSIHPIPCALVLYGSLTCTGLAKLAQEDAVLVAPDSIQVGLFDPLNGGGSLLGVELEREVVVPIAWGEFISELQYSDETRATYGYSIQDVYGFCGDLTEFEIHTS